MSHQWTRSTRARSLTLFATLFAALGVLSLFVAQAGAVPLTGSASPLPGSTFEGGDANQEASNLLRTDWASPGVNPVNPAPDPNANDNIFAGGAEGKESNPGNWNFATQDGGSTPGKNNILDAYTHTPAGSGDVFLDLAFTRGSDTGTTYMAFELNKRADLWNNGKANIPCRTTGDIIVSYQVSGNSPDVILQKWTSATSDAGTGCAKTGTLTDYTAVIDNVNAQGAVNAAEIQNYLASSYPWPGNKIPAKLFGEASLNLTSLLSGALGTPCFSFGSIWMHTRASTSDSSNLDDYIAPRPLLVRNCSASGTKFHDLDGDGVKDAGEPGLAGFRMWADYDNDGIRDADEPFADTDANGDYVITNVQDPSGTYSIREQLTAGAGTGGWTCSYPATTASGGAFPCAYTGINGATTPNATGKDFGNYKPAVVNVEKQTVPDGAAGSFAFTSTIPGKGSFNLSDGGVESTSVAPGTYTATETLHADFDLTGIACTGDDDSNGAGQTATFRAQSGETITCTFTNTRKTGQLTVRKVLDPASDAGKFDLSIGNDLVVDDGGHLAQGSRTLPTGTGYTVSEAAGTGTSLAKYDSGIECRDGDTVVKSGSGTSLAGVPVIEGHNVICTFTNVRRTGTIEVVKDLVPNDDGGTFDLKVGDDVVAAGVGDGGKGSKSVAPGTYSVSEAGAAGTSLADYDKSVACLRNGQPAENGNGASLDVAVDSNDAVVCTITNTRRPGKLTVVKDLLPSTDGGRFDLRIDGDVVKAGAGDGDGGSKELAPGDYVVSEVAADGTSLASYDASIACDNGQDGNGSSLEVSVDSNDDITCTITNERRPGSLTVVKDLQPEDDGGTFDLKVGDDVVAAGVGDGGTGSKSVAPGTYTVSEAGAAGTSLAKYDASIACDNGQQGSGSSLEVSVDSNDDITCTITNERRAGSITVVKDLLPGNDGGTFDLKVGDDVVKAAAGDGGTGTKAVAPGTYTVSEAAAGDTSLADYDSDVACLKNEAAYKSGTGTSIGGLDVDSGDDIVCTITNVRRGSVTLSKTEGGQAPTRTWTFRLTGGPDDVSITKDTAADGSVEFGSLKPGAYTLCEIDLPAGWHSSLGADACVDLEIEPGEAETVAVDNTRPETLVIKEGNKLVHHGDTITYTFDVSNKGNTPLKDVSVEDARCDTAPVRDAAHDQNDDGDALLEEGEVWRFTCTMVVPADHDDDEENPIVNEATAHAFDLAGNEVTASDKHETTIIHPEIKVVKTGAEFAYAGDTVTYTFAVTNPGDTPLSGVTVEDDRCAPVSGPTQKQGGNADDLLDPGETWTFTCAKQVPAGHKIGDENPIVNVATATGTDALGKTVTSTNDHKVRVLHPAVDIKKMGPATATVGTPLGYTLTVTNPGDVPFAAQEVVVTDPRCEAPPAGPATGADQTPGQLDPGDTWIYTCTAQTVGQPAGTFVNTATVTAKDSNGRTVTDTDEFPTVLQAPPVVPPPANEVPTVPEEQVVLPTEVVSGTARLRGPSGCVKKAFKATVRGRRIASVTFYVDGKRQKKLVAKSGQRVFRVKVRPGSAVGVHRVTARVVFKASSQTKSRTLRLTYRRCVRQVVTPQFTG